VPTTVPIAVLVTEPVAKPAALLNNHSGIQLLLFFLSFNTSSNSYAAFFIFLIF